MSYDDIKAGGAAVAMKIDDSQVQPGLERVSKKLSDLGKMMRGAGALGGISYISHSIGAAADELRGLQEKMARGEKVEWDQVVVSAGKLVPVVGDAVEAGNKLGMVLAGVYGIEAKTAQMAEATNRRLAARLAIQQQIAAVAKQHTMEMIQIQSAIDSIGKNEYDRAVIAEKARHDTRIQQIKNEQNEETKKLRDSIKLSSILIDSPVERTQAIQRDESKISEIDAIYAEKVKSENELHSRRSVDLYVKNVRRAFLERDTLEEEYYKLVNESQDESLKKSIDNINTEYEKRSKTITASLADEREKIEQLQLLDRNRQKAIENAEKEHAKRVNQPLLDRIAQAELDAIKDPKKRLQTERERAIADAQTTGANIDLVNTLYDMLAQNSAESQSIRTYGAFNSLQMSGLTSVNPTVKAANETAKNTKESAMLLSEIVKSVRNGGGGIPIL